MLDIVTLQEAKDWLRVDAGWDDDVIDTLIEAATEAVLATADGYTYDPATPAPGRIRLAILAHVARAYDDRDSVDAPEGNVRLLGPLRRLDV